MSKSLIMILHYAKVLVMILSKNQRAEDDGDNAYFISMDSKKAWTKNRLEAGLAKLAKVMVKFNWTHLRFKALKVKHLVKIKIWKQGLEAFSYARA
ncbi:hypothetical protein Tco_1025376 [Tanacetum coccineum]